MKFLTSKKDSLITQFTRYTMVGAIAFSVDFTLLFILTELFKISYLISAAIAFTFGLVTNYTLCTYWVFTKRSVRDKWVEFGLFALIGLIGLGFNEVIIWICTGILGLYYLVSKILSTVIVYAWNFFARKYTLFN